MNMRHQAVRLFMAVALVAAVLVSGIEPAAAWDESTGYSLTANQSRTADDSLLIMQSDGNLVLYHTQSGSPSAVWHTNTWGNPGAWANFQSDGNLVVYSSSGAVLFQAGTGGNAGASFVLTDDGNFSIYSVNSILKYSSNTSRTPSSGGTPAGALSWSARWADGSYHTHVTTESTASDRINYQFRFDGPGGETPWEPTDMSIVKAGSYSIYTDVYWYVTPLTSPNPPAIRRAVVNCPRAIDADRCDQFRLRIDDDSDTLSQHRQNDMVCHEMGHTLGFHHAGTTGDTGSSCLTWGLNSDPGWWEVNSVNGRF